MTFKELIEIQRASAQATGLLSLYIETGGGVPPEMLVAACEKLREASDAFHSFVAGRVQEG